MSDSDQLYMAAELRQILAAVAETTAPDGSSKFHARDTEALRRMVAARAHWKTLYGYAHFVAALSRRFSVDRFLLVDAAPARRSLFETTLQTEITKRPHPDLGLRESGLLLQLDGADFVIAFRQMPLYAAWHSFLAYLPIPAERTACLQALADSETFDDIRSATRRLDRALTGYFNEALPPVQAKMHQRAILDFMKRHVGADFRTTDIDDEIVISFWEENCEESSKRLYRTIADIFQRFREAMAAVQTTPSVETAESLTEIPDEDEFDGDQPRTHGLSRIDPQYVVDMWSASSPHDDPLSDLPASPKLLKDTDAQRLQPVIGLGPLASTWTRTVLRKAVLAPLQTAWKSGGHSQQPREGYAAYLARLEALSGNIDTVLDATFHALFRHRPLEAITHLHRYAPEVADRIIERLRAEFPESEAQVDNVYDLDVCDIMADAGALPENTALRALVERDDLAAELRDIARDVLDSPPSDDDPEDDTIVSFQKAAKQRYSRTRRAGFSEPVDDAAFATALPNLLLVRKRLSDFRRKLASDLPHHDDVAQQFEYDRERFVATLERIYEKGDRQ